jgi:hypothetical protein
MASETFDVVATRTGDELIPDRTIADWEASRDSADERYARGARGASQARFHRALRT